MWKSTIFCQLPVAKEGIKCPWWRHRLGAFWFERTVSAARLGLAEFRIDGALEERRPAAALLRSWIALVRELADLQRSPGCALASPMS